MKNSKYMIALAVFLVPLGVAGAQAQTPSRTPGAVATTGSTAAAASDYRLVAGDKLRIEVYKDPQLSQSLQVRPDGKITLPLIGDVGAAGLTPMALRDKLTTSLKEYLTNPVVTVIVVEANEPTVSVMGEVNNPGVQRYKHQMTVIDALATAGGFKDFADMKRLQIQRTDATGVKRILFNYKDATNPNKGIKPLYLQPGDIIIVR